MHAPVFVHVGPGKTGTTTIQRSLHERRDALGRLGVQVPGITMRDTRWAVYDLMGRRIRGGDNAGVAGAFEPWAASIAGSEAPTVVCSEEMLALARPGQVRRLVSSLAPRRVIVVLTLRDLASVLASSWQQSVLMGRTETFDEFLAATRGAEGGTASVSIAFWLRQDVARILDSWGRWVPVEDMRIVVLPRPGGAPSLEDRFASVIGVPPGVLTLQERANASLGAPEVEVIRRLNAGLGDVRENERLNLVRVLRLALRERPSAAVAVPADELEWINRRTDQWCAHIRAGGYQVVGSLDDLVAGSAPGARRPTDPQVADAAVDALAALARDHARLWARHRQRRAAVEPGGGRVASLARAATFRSKTAALDKADDNRLLAWAARRYLKRTAAR